MEEISGCDSASSNAIQARLACPRQFLTPSTLPLGLGCPRPNTPCPPAWKGWDRGDSGTVRGGQQRDVVLAQRLTSKQANPCACHPLSLGCSADGLLEAPLALSRH